MALLGIQDYDLFDPGNAYGYGGDTPERRQKEAYLVENILPHLTDLPRDAEILEIGPGFGVFLELLKKQGYTGVRAFEICTSYAEALRARGFDVSDGPSTVEFLRMSVQDYDAIVLIDVLEHVDPNESFELMIALRENLKPGGKVIIQVPNRSGLFGNNTYFADITHRAGYNELGLQALLKTAGFARSEAYEMRLPRSLANLGRSLCRRIVFRGARLLMRIVGATPIQVLTHNLIVVGQAPLS